MKFDLVFEGGGAKGMVFVGAYQEFINRSHTYGRLLGTSAGAITAVLIAAGYKPQEMLSALDEKENGKPVFANFMGEPNRFTDEEIHTSAIRKLLHNVNIKLLPDFIENHMDDAIVGFLAKNERARHLFSFVERGGWYGANQFVSWLQTKLDTGPWKNGTRKFSHMTLKQFFNETQVDFSVVSSDTTDGRMLVLNHHTAPDCPVVWAVRMSMSIPLVWEEVIWDKGWGLYLSNDISGHAIVDGGLLSNFPIELFISNEPQVLKLMGSKSDGKVLGLLIDETLPVATSRNTKGLLIDINVKPGELKTVQRLSRLVDTATTAHDKMVIDEFNHLVVRLPAKGYGTTEFDMNDGRKNLLIEAGRNAMRDYLDKMTSAVRATRGLQPTGQKADRIAERILGL